MTLSPQLERAIIDMAQLAGFRQEERLVTRLRYLLLAAKHSGMQEMYDTLGNASRFSTIRDAAIEGSRMLREIESEIPCNCWPPFGMLDAGVPHGERCPKGLIYG